MFDHYVCDGKKKFRIDKASTNDTSLIGSRKEAEEKLEKNNSEIDQLQARLYADKKEGVIFLFQALSSSSRESPQSFRASSICSLVMDFMVL